MRSGTSGASPVTLLLQHSIDLRFFLNELGWLHDILSEDVSLDEVRKPDSQLMGDEL